MISEFITELVDILFKEPDRTEVTNALAKVFIGPYKDVADRVCCAVLKLSVSRNLNGNIEKFRKAYEWTDLDYRDLFVRVGFANSTTRYKLWADSIRKKTYAKTNK